MDIIEMKMLFGIIVLAGGVILIGIAVWTMLNKRRKLGVE